MTAGVAPARLTPRTLGGLPVLKVADMAPHINTLIYGEPGVGKTRLCASCDEVPQMRNVLILDVDGGALSAKEVYPNVERVRITRFQQLIDVYVDLRADASHGFQTVVLDTATEAQKYDMAAIMYDAVQKAAAAEEDRDPDVPLWREWGITSEHMRRLIRSYRDLPMNFIMTCHVKDDKDEKTGLVKKAPDLPGKLARQVAGLFDVVLYMYSKSIPAEGGESKDIRLLMSSATERITAKDRTDKLEPIIQTITMKHLYETMTGVKKK